MGYVVVADAGTVYGDYFCDTCTMIRYGNYLHPMDTISEGDLEELALEIEANAKKIVNAYRETWTKIREVEDLYINYSRRREI